MGWIPADRRRFLRRAAIAAAGFTAFWLLAVWPPPVWYRTHWPHRTAFMALRPAQGQRYQPVPLDSIAPAMAEAAIAGEDNNFYTHGGIDYLALARALGYERRRFSWGDREDRAELWSVLPGAWRHRDRLRGASTITQQLAKNLYLSPSRNPLRKVKEAVTAWRLEAALGKPRILELYLNVVELGDRVWGVEAASQLYFGVPARRLSRLDAAALAATLPFPRRSNPLHRPGRMLARRELILRKMAGEAVEVPVVEEAAEPDTTGMVEGDSLLVEPEADTLAAPEGEAPVLGDSAGAAPPAPSDLPDTIPAAPPAGGEPGE